MTKELFKSNRYFVLFDYLIGHGQLLLRSDKQDKYNENIDVIFYNVAYLQTFTMLKGLEIRIINKTDFNDSNSVKEYLSYNNHHLFELQSGDEKYYIAASFVKVFENKLDFKETSLGFLQDKGKEIISSC